MKAARSALGEQLAGRAEREIPASVRDFSRTTSSKPPAGAVPGRTPEITISQARALLASSATLRRIQNQGLAVEAVRIHHKGVGHDRPQTPRRGIRQLVLPCVPDVVRGVIEAQRALKRRARDEIDRCGPLHVDNREGAAGVTGPAVESFPGGRPCLRARSPPTGHATTTAARG